MSALNDAYRYLRHAGSTFWLVIIATFLNQSGNMAFVFLLVYLTRHIGLSLPQASFAFAVFCASMLFTGIACGSFIDRFGPARAMIASLTGNALILLLFPLVHHNSLILIMCTLWGLTYGVYRPAAQTLMTCLSKPGMHTITFSIYRLAQNLGMSIGPALGGYLIHYSYGALFFSNGISNLIACIMLFFTLSGTHWFTSQQAHAHRAPLSLKWLQQDSALQLFILSMIPVCMVFFQHESTLAVFLAADLHLSLSFYGWLFTINTLLIVCFELLLNVLMMHWPYRVNFMVGSFLITVGFAGLFFATQAWHVLLLTVIWTFGEMILFPSASSYIAEIAPAEHRGSYMSFFSTSTNLGLLLGPLAGAVAMGHLGASGLWLICGLWGLISVGLFYFQPEPLAHLDLKQETA